ncbi:coiled-coil and C2 domain-containing protein 2A [Euwallacea fornicatus]|uniref:coiled-coil and C2 domain-containing protein 2A n=1 Tax=Euwallacea fornicatus TaxID=995702 RepID=UPI00338E1266
MNSSKEDLLELSEQSAPPKKPPRLSLKKRYNRVHSPPIASPDRSSDREVTSIFSVKKSRAQGDNQTSSDEVPLEDYSRGNGDKVIKLKQSLKRLKIENLKVENKIKSVRQKLSINQHNVEQFNFVISEIAQGSADDDEDDLVTFLPPVQLSFSNTLKATLRFSNEHDESFNPVRLRCLKSFALPLMQSTKYVPASTHFAQSLQEILVIKDHILDLEINSIEFLHHPLFSIEHVLLQRLKDALKKHSQWDERRSVSTLLLELGKLRNSGKYKAMRRLRERVFQEAKQQRQLLKTILELWLEIKKFRETQKFSCTPARLRINQQQSGASSETEQLFQEVLEDILVHSKKNLKWSRNDIEADLRRVFLESFRRAEEPELQLKLIEEEIQTNAEIDSDEASRRKVVSSTKFTINISCDQIPVCKSRPVFLDPTNFQLYFNEVFSIQLTEVPKWLTLELFEYPKGLLKKKIAHLKLEIPPCDLIFETSVNQESFFERRELIHYKHAGVGSGQKLSLAVGNVPEDVLYTKGVVTYRIGWQPSRAPRDMPEGDVSGRNNGLVNTVDSWRGIDSGQLHSMLTNCGEYEEELRSFEGILESIRESGCFRLSPDLNPLFCPLAAIDANVRFQFLRLRSQNEPEFDGTPVPSRIREIPVGLIKDFQRRKALEGVDQKGGTEDDGDGEDLRESGRRRLKQVHHRVFHLCKGAGNNLSYESVIDEKYLIYFEEIVKTSVRNVLNWFRWRPKFAKPLPQRVPRPLQDTRQTPNKILVKVLGAKNLPQRRVSEDAPSEEIVPELEICHEEFTVTVEMPGGTRSEIVGLPLRCQHGDYMNPNALSGNITIALFDRTQSLSSGGEYVERKVFLGDVLVPLSALTTGINLSGWFQLTRPALIFGYNGFEDPTVKTFLQLELSISPSVPVMEPNMADLPSNDSPYLSGYILRWNQVFNTNFPSKRFQVFVLDTQGRTTCITRFLRPLEPPQVTTDDFDFTAEHCLRYISLVPFTESGSLYQSILLTSEQFLRFMTGSVLDHCVTLTCFLLALKLEAYLVLGFGVPRGTTSYVFLIESSKATNNCQNYSILDVLSNQKFKLSDPLCPLQRIYCLANGENVWGNAQRTQNPALLRFDLTRKSDWWPLFDNNHQAPTHFVNNKVDFSLNSDEEEVEREVERKLRRKLCKWRPMETTNIKIQLNEVLRSNLRHFEINIMHGRGNADAVQELIKTLSRFHVDGMVLNLPFSGVTQVVKKIKNMRLHVQAPGVTDFVLSVFVQGYPGQVLSLWVLIGTVAEKVPQDGSCSE